VETPAGIGPQNGYLMGFLEGLWREKEGRKGLEKPSYG
jgi:hypothetical protein